MDLQTKIDDMDVSVRLRLSLKSIGCETVADIMQYDRLEFMKMRGFGKVTYSELMDWLYDNHLKPKEETL